MKRKVIKMEKDKGTATEFEEEPRKIIPVEEGVLGNDRFTNSYAEDFQEFAQNQRDIIQKGEKEIKSGKNKGEMREMTKKEYDKELERQRDLYRESYFDSTEYGKQTQEIEAKIERYRKILANRGKKALSPYEVEKRAEIRERIEKLEQERNGLRQDYEDSFAVASPEDEEALKKWRQSQDELEAEFEAKQKAKQEAKPEPDNPDGSGSKPNNNPDNPDKPNNDPDAKPGDGSNNPNNPDGPNNPNNPNGLGSKPADDTDIPMRTSEQDRKAGIIENDDNELKQTL